LPDPVERDDLVDALGDRDLVAVLVEGAREMAEGRSGHGLDTNARAIVRGADRRRRAATGPTEPGEASRKDIFANTSLRFYAGRHGSRPARRHPAQGALAPGAHAHPGDAAHARPGHRIIDRPTPRTQLRRDELPPAPAGR